MELERARAIAEKLVEKLSPYCERIEIAGSIRREKAEVGDIEIVAIPNDFADAMLLSVLPGASFVKEGSRYKQIALPEGIDLDLFLVRPPAQWGVIFLLRTGPAEFSHQAVTRKCFFRGLLPSDCVVADGQVWRHGKLIPMPEEEDFLKLLGLPGLAPQERGRHV
jgi:DNA polymerase/3'-5' exonuclease PolX